MIFLSLTALVVERVRVAHHYWPDCGCVTVSVEQSQIVVSLTHLLPAIALCSLGWVGRSDLSTDCGLPALLSPHTSHLTTVSEVTTLPGMV